MDTFSPPPSRFRPKLVHPLTDKPMGAENAESLNMTTAPNGAHQHRKLTVVDPPNCCLRATNVQTFFLAAARTDLPDDANRSIGRT